MAYPPPESWSHIRLPSVKTHLPDPPILKAARYQIQVCENIAAEYGKRSARRGREGRSFSASTALLTAAGVATTGAAALFDDDSDEQTVLTISGLVLTFIGTGLAVGNVFTGNDRAESYTNAAESVSDAIADFRAALRDGSLNTDDPNVLKERICTLRSACFQRYADLELVREPFAFQPAGSTLPADLIERPLVDEYVTAFCSHASTGAGPEIAVCTASGAARSAPCTEAVCEAALLDKTHVSAITLCKEWSARRQAEGDPAATDPAQGGTRSRSENPANRVQEIPERVR